MSVWDAYGMNLLCHCCAIQIVSYNVGLRGVLQCKGCVIAARTGQTSKCKYLKVAAGGKRMQERKLEHLDMKMCS